jgi:hypothetical protein
MLTMADALSKAVVRTFSSETNIIPTAAPDAKIAAPKRQLLKTFIASLPLNCIRLPGSVLMCTVLHQQRSLASVGNLFASRLVDSRPDGGPDNQSSYERGPRVIVIVVVIVMDNDGS